MEGPKIKSGGANCVTGGAMAHPVCMLKKALKPSAPINIPLQSPDFLDITIKMDFLFASQIKQLNCIVP